MPWFIIIVTSNTIMPKLLVAHRAILQVRLDTIEFCSIRGLGHTWPGSTCCTERCLGEPCDPAEGDMPASTYMLDFFSRLPPADAGFDEAKRTSAK